MKMKRKLLAGIGAAMMVVSACAVSASAITLTANLHASESVKYSAKASNYYGEGTLKASNQGYSAGNVLVLSKYQSGVIWYQAHNISLAPGGNTNTSNNAKSNKHTWQLGLNPDGANKYGCTAEGTLALTR